MKRLITYSIAVLICLSPDLVLAQIEEAKRDIEQMNRSLFENPKQSIEAEYRLYTNHHTTEISERLKVISKRNHNRMYHKLDQIETVIGNEFSIVVDHGGKTLMVDRNQMSVEDMILGYDVELALQYCSKLEKLNDIKGFNGYRMEIPHPEIESIAFYFDASSYVIHKLVFYYRQAQQLFSESTVYEKPKLELVFLKVDNNPSFKNDTFDINKYLTRRDGIFYPVLAFKDYIFLDNTKYTNY